MKSKIMLMAALVFSSACNGEEEIGWPALPTDGFVTGRAAANDEVDSGQAVFSMDGQGRPIAIAIPQYAFWTDEDGNEHPVIVVQAERAPTGMEIVGLLMPDGSHTVATMPELKLLGKEKPN